MYKKITLALLLLCALLAITACGEKKILHCDECGKEVTVAANSNMEEDWILFCAECGDIDLEEAKITD